MTSVAWSSKPIRRGPITMPGPILNYTQCSGMLAVMVDMSVECALGSTSQGKIDGDTRWESTRMK